MKQQTLEDAPSESEVKDVPDNFKQWVKGNQDRIAAARSRGTEPYFLRDNAKQVDKILAASNKPTPLEIAAQRHAARTPEQVADIQSWSNNHTEYLKLRADKNYKDVEFNPANGGLRATHVLHNFDSSKGWYELKVQEIGFKNANAVVLGFENHTNFRQRNTDGTWNGLKFELACAETGTSQNIRNALKHCASKKDAKVAVILSLNKLTDAQIREGVSRFGGLKGTSQWQKFQKILFVFQDGTIKKYH